MSDEDLVNRSLQERDFFGCIIKRYEEKLLRYILRITSISYHEAQDLLQDSFIKAYVHLNAFDTDLKFSSWMYRITYNHVISSYRKKHVRPEGNIADIEDDVLERIASDEDILLNMEKSEQREFLHASLRTLPEMYREVLILYFFEEKDYREISDIIQKPMGTVATLLSRAKKKLRDIHSKE